jgi:hypothetical protein
VNAGNISKRRYSRLGRSKIRRELGGSEITQYSLQTAIMYSDSIMPPRLLNSTLRQESTAWVPSYPRYFTKSLSVSRRRQKGRKALSSVLPGVFQHGQALKQLRISPND